MRIELAGKSFGARPVLGPVTLELGRGRRVAVLGPSGIGKSTLLRIVAGLDGAHEGLRVSGAARLALVFQEPTLLPWRSALANITIPARVDAGRARALMAQVGLAGKEAHYPRQLSLGQQRRLALARAFATSPDVLLMDEPFASLDAETAARMIALTSELLDRTGAGLFLVTHAPAEAEALGAEAQSLSGSPAVLSPTAPSAPARPAT
ncbi:MAG: ATP-binding cassette domain-containing protein [Paracoccus sp. (in: a-proteobacteria)]|nr:ATP-binding cassette domain-containing protein [Paracoccus sp. (in: a-proteobacteria)]